jgi:D-alanine--poly(phosphoribitol) ligase subunit 1
MPVPAPRPLPVAGPAHGVHPLLAHLPARDRRLFRRFGWGPARPAPELPVHRAVERWAAIVPEAVAAEHRGEQLTYRDLNRQADRLAARLVAEGVRAGSAVGVFTERSLPMLVAILAALKAGAAYVPQDPRIAPPELLRAVADTAACPVLLTTTAMRERMPAGRTVIAVDQATARPGGAAGPRVRVGADDPCYVIFTSGTTGRPNGVPVTHRNVANILLTRPGDLGVRPGVRVAQLLNVAFDMAAWEILGCLATGGTLLPAATW